MGDSQERRVEGRSIRSPSWAFGVLGTAAGLSSRSQPKFWLDNIIIWPQKRGGNALAVANSPRRMAFTIFVSQLAMSVL